MKRNMIRLVVLLCTLPVSAVVMAHTGSREADGFFSGVLHPLLGVDHLLALLAIGLWAASGPGCRNWLPPLAFLCFLVTGTVLALRGVALPGVETGVAVSVLVPGLLLMTLARVRMAGSVTLIALFALFHGHAHGQELPAAAAQLPYALGLVITSGLLLLAGQRLGQWMRQAGTDWLLRGAGVVSGGAGVWLVLGA